MRYEFTLDLVPVPKGRPRFRRFGNLITTYTPAATKKAEKAISDQIKALYSEPPIEVGCYLDLEFHFSVPKSYTRKKREMLAADGWKHTIKPDCDNLAKTVLDALNGVLYKDDDLIHTLNIKKRYSDKDFIVVKIETA